MTVMVGRELKNWLLIAGNGRHVGKTWLSELCIHQLSKSHKVIALKIASHMHDVSDDIKWLKGETGKWMIGEEHNHQSLKDSGRMLKAGADKVYYAQMTDDCFLRPMLEFIETQLDDNIPVVCESAALGDLIQPGLALYVFDRLNLTKQCRWDFDYSSFESVKSNIINPPKEVRWERNSWQIN